MSTTVTLKRRDATIIYAIIFVYPNANAFISSCFDTIIGKFSSYNIYPNDDGSLINAERAPEILDLTFSEAELIAIRKAFSWRLKGTQEHPPVSYGAAKITIWPIANLLGFTKELRDEFEKTIYDEAKAEGQEYHKP